MHRIRRYFSRKNLPTGAYKHPQMSLTKSFLGLKKYPVSIFNMHIWKEWLGKATSKFKTKIF